jgi:hypothetical protein
MVLTNSSLTDNYSTRGAFSSEDNSGALLNRSGAMIVAPSVVFSNNSNTPTQADLVNGSGVCATSVVNRGDATLSHVSLLENGATCANSISMRRSEGAVVMNPGSARSRAGLLFDPGSGTVCGTTATNTIETEALVHGSTRSPRHLGFPAVPVA